MIGKLKVLRCSLENEEMDELVGLLSPSFIIDEVYCYMFDSMNILRKFFIRLITIIDLTYLVGNFY
jgi:hypothetical protein